MEAPYIVFIQTVSNHKRVNQLNGANTTEPRERLLELLRERSLKRGHFKLSSGGTSSYYVDCRMTTPSPNGLNLIGRLIVSRQKGLGVCGARK